MSVLLVQVSSHEDDPGHLTILVPALCSPLRLKETNCRHGLEEDAEGAGVGCRSLAGSHLAFDVCAFVEAVQLGGLSGYVPGRE